MRCKIILFCLCLFCNVANAEQRITFPRSSGLGDSIIPFCWAHILSQKYNIPLYVTANGDDIGHIRHFNISQTGIRKIQEKDFSKWKIVIVNSESDIQKHLQEDNVLFLTTLRTSCYFSEDLYIPALKEALKLNSPIEFEEPPSQMTSIVVHIRKGEQCMYPWVGALASQQYYSITPGTIHYAYQSGKEVQMNALYSPLLYKPRICEKEATDHLPVKPFSFVYFDKVPDWETKFPPEQYYVEALKEISAKLNHKPLFVRIITDDNKNPLGLVLRIKEAVNLKNLQFHYVDCSHLAGDERLKFELYALSQHDIFIRSQSYFSRVAEMIGNHQLVYAPIVFKWKDNSTLIMTKVGVKKADATAGLKF